jgi:hypothetical protein
MLARVHRPEQNLPMHRLLPWITLFAVSLPAAGQTVKCRDAAGRTTYSNVPCVKQGLHEAGPVQERTTTMRLAPANRYQGGATPAMKDAPGAAKPDGEIGPTPAAAQVKAVNPLIQQLSK